MSQEAQHAREKCRKMKKKREPTEQLFESARDIAPGKIPKSDNSLVPNVIFPMPGKGSEARRFAKRRTRGIPVDAVKQTYICVYTASVRRIEPILRSATGN